MERKSASLVQSKLWSKNKKKCKNALRRWRKSTWLQLRRKLFSNLKEISSKDVHTTLTSSSSKTMPKSKNKLSKHKSAKMIVPSIPKQAWTPMVHQHLAKEPLKWLLTQRTQDLTPSYQENTNLCPLVYHNIPRLTLTLEVLVVWLFTCANRLLQLLLTTAHGKFSTWIHLRTSWLVRVTKTGLVVSIFTLLVLT